LNFLKIENVITDDHKIIKAKTIPLPGVGSLLQGMKNPNDRGLSRIAY
jgi:imidazoleglycerol phosphate synthase glutamine amidotransferase subunit HisH